MKSGLQILYNPCYWEKTRHGLGREGHFNDSTVRWLSVVGALCISRSPTADSEVGLGDPAVQPCADADDGG